MGGIPLAAALLADGANGLAAEPRVEAVLVEGMSTRGLPQLLSR